MLKSTTNAYNWNIYDTSRDIYNVAQYDLLPNSSASEAVINPSLDFLSNGFKIRASSIGLNNSGDNFIYMAFAENPFKYANAR